MALQDIFITNMKYYRKQRKLTHEKLAEQCDSDPRYISQIETGRRFPSLQFIEKIAKALHVVPYHLFYEETGLDFDIPNRKQALTAALINRVTGEIKAVIQEFHKN
jgi:transcriptional regulator with XRE-family HTH domain